MPFLVYRNEVEHTTHIGYTSQYSVYSTIYMHSMISSTSETPLSYSGKADSESTGPWKLSYGQFQTGIRDCYFGLTAYNYVLYLLER